MERMDTLDAEFLHLEDGIVHMHIGAACVFADPPPSFDDIAGMIAAKLHLHPPLPPASAFGAVRAGPTALGRRSPLQPRLPSATHSAAGTW